MEKLQHFQNFWTTAGPLQDHFCRKKWSCNGPAKSETQKCKLADIFTDSFCLMTLGSKNLCVLIYFLLFEWENNRAGAAGIRVIEIVCSRPSIQKKGS